MLKTIETQLSSVLIYLVIPNSLRYEKNIKKEKKGNPHSMVLRFRYISQKLTIR